MLNNHGRMHLEQSRKLSILLFLATAAVGSLPCPYALLPSQTAWPVDRTTSCAAVVKSQLTCGGGTAISGDLGRYHNLTFFGSDLAATAAFQAAPTLSCASRCTCLPNRDTVYRKVIRVPGPLDLRLLDPLLFMPFFWQPEARCSHLESSTS